MDIDIAPYIKELLFKHNTLVIPGFGNFVLTYASSTVDHVQGMLNPPSKKIEFDNNLITNDGKLQAYIQEKHQINSEDANAVINAFVSKVKAQLGQREMVVLPEVGRLYKDFEDSVQFISDATNFNKESFGLPSINFYPILREKSNARKSALAAKKVENTKTKTKTPPKKRATIKQEEKGFFASLFSNAWVPALLSIILFSGFITCLVRRNAANSIAEQTERVNQRPTRVADEENEDPREDIVDRQIEEALEQEEEAIDTESITVNPNQKECIVSIGVYSMRDNAMKIIKKVYDKGYDAYRDNYERNGKEYTKVGIQFGYETVEEFDAQMRKIKRDFPDAVVIKK